MAFQHVGIELLLLGWVGIFEGKPAWLANPALLLAVWLLVRPKVPSARSVGVTVVLAVLAIPLALSGLNTGVWLAADDFGVDEMQYPLPGAIYWTAICVTGAVVMVGFALSDARRIPFRPARRSAQRWRSPRY